MFEELQDHYQNIYSLGSNCQAAYHLKINYLRFETGPFDWFTTNHLETISKNISNHFESFFLAKNMEIIGGNKEDKYYHYRDRYTDYTCFHDILTNRDQAEQLDLFHEKFRRRTNQFFQQIHTSEKNLLIRILCEEDEHILDLDQALYQEFGCCYKLIGILVENRDRISLRKLNDRTFLCKMNTNTNCIDKDQAWKGNMANWEALFSEVHYRNSGLKQFYFQQRKRKIDIIKRSAARRKILVWGYGNALYMLEQILKTSDITISNFYSDHAEDTNSLPKDRIVKKSTIDRNIYYVIIVMQDDNHAAENYLIDKNFRNKEDYLFFFETEENPFDRVFH